MIIFGLICNFSDFYFCLLLSIAILEKSCEKMAKVILQPLVAYCNCVSELHFYDLFIFAH